MRLLVVHAHPLPDSFGAALLRAALDGAREGGHEARALDLHAEGFQPVLTAEERRRYDDDPPPDPAALDPALGPHVAALRWAEGILLVHPTWWGGPPAILKGWLDRAWRPGVAFHAEGGGLRPGLPGVRLLGVLTTLASPRWAWALQGQPGRRMVLRTLRPFVARRARTLWLALHDMDKATPERRAAHLARVRATVAALR